MEANGTAWLLYLFFVIAAAGAIVALTAAIGSRRARPARGAIYECGVDQASPPRRRVAVHFVVIAALFLIFDAEIVLLFPWAAAFRDALAAGEGLGLLELAVFLGLLALALTFAWGQGALEWEA